MDSQIDNISQLYRQVSLKRAYKREDLLYKVCYDKMFRPAVFQAVTSGQKVDRDDFDQAEGDKSVICEQDLRELRYV